MISTFPLVTEDGVERIGVEGWIRASGMDNSCGAETAGWVLTAKYLFL